MGLVTLGTSVDLKMLKANFSLSHLLDLSHNPAPQHAEIDMVCMNPIFTHRARELLSGVQRLLKASWCWILNLEFES